MTELHAPAAPGQAILEVARVGARSVVTRAAARSPLRLLLPRNHGQAVWAYQVSLGGGLVDGDDIALRVRVGAGAAALVTTQAQTKVYRSPRGCRQRVEAEVEADGLLVLLPDPVVCFAGARLMQEVRVRLGAGASLVLVEALSCGRAARGERWAFDRYRSAVAIDRCDAPLLRDAIDLDAGHGAIAARMGRFDALATVIAAGPRGGNLNETFRDHDWIAARSPLGNDGVLVRAAATSVERLGRGVRELLDGLASLLGDDPLARKW